MVATKSLARLVFSACFCAACANGTTARSPAPPAATADKPTDARVTSFGIDESVLRLMASVGAQPAQLFGRDENDSETRLPGVTVEVAPAKSREVVRAVRGRLPAGYLVFVHEMSFGIAGKPDLVAVMKAPDLFAVIRAVGTNGWNYDIGPQHIVERLRLWNTRYGLVLTGAGFDWLEAEFVHAPADMPAFAHEVFEFCPDVVEQGTGTEAALADEMRRANSVYLWWD